MKEQVLNFPCDGEHLVGILAEPEPHDCPAADVGVLIIVGGPQYRAGSHRQFTLLARHLASQGFTTMRFDYRGMGDSDGDARDFLQVGSDIKSAIDALLTASPALKRVILWGLCDAASAILLHLESTCDNRVAGIALLNPWVRSNATLARTHVKHHYIQRLRRMEFWIKLLKGGIGASALRGLANSLWLAFRAGEPETKSRGFQDRMAAGLRSFKGPSLLILSGNDYTAREFCLHAASSTAWAGLLDLPTLRRHDLPNADHTFSEITDQDAQSSIFSAWLRTACQST